MTTTPTALYPTFSQLIDDQLVVDGAWLDLTNATDWYLAGKIVSPVQVPGEAPQSDLGIDGRLLSGRILRSALAGSYGDASKDGFVAFGERAIPCVGQAIDPLAFKCRKIFYSHKIDAERVSRYNALGVNGLIKALAVPRRQAAIVREKAWRDLFLTTSNWANTQAASAVWTNAASTPIKDIGAACAKVGKFVAPNTMIISYAAANALTTNAEFLAGLPRDIDSATVRMDRMADLLKSRFSLDRVFIGRANADTSRKADGSAINGIWGSGVWVGYLSDNLAAVDGDVMADDEMSVSAAVSIVAQDWTPTIKPIEAGEDDDSYTALVRLTEALVVAYPQLGCTLTGALT